MNHPPPSLHEIRAITDGIARPAFAKDIDLRFVAANEAFLRSFGVSLASIEGRTTVEVFGLDALPEEEEVLVFGARQTAKFSHEGRDYNFTFVREGSLSTTPFVIGTLESTYVHPVSPAPAPAPVGSPRPVRRSDDAMTDLANIARHMKAGVVLVDRTLTILATNDMLHKVWDIDPDGIGIGDSFGDFLDAGRANRETPVSDAEWRDHLNTVLGDIANGNVPTRDIAMVDGRTLFASGVALSGGRTMLTFEDVSLRDHSIGSIVALKKTAEASERLMYDVLDNIPAAVVVYDRNDNFILDNKARRTMLPSYSEVMREGAPHDASLLQRGDAGGQDPSGFRRLHP